MSEVTQLLNAIDTGEANAAEQLLPLVYDELRKLAVARKAVMEIRDLEDAMTSGKLGQEQVVASMRDIAELAGIAASSTEEAIDMSKGMKEEISRFISWAEKDLVQKVREESSAGLEVTGVWWLPRSSKPATRRQGVWWVRFPSTSARHGKGAGIRR